MSFPSEGLPESWRSYIPKAIPRDIQWTNRNDLLVFFKSLQIAEIDLQIPQPYHLYLTKGPVILTDQTGSNYRVEKASLVTMKDQSTPSIFITDVNLDKPSYYRVTNPSTKTSLEVMTSRNDQIAISVAEEIYHLHEYFSGLLPTEIDEVNSPQKYAQPGHEQRALYYRFRLLAQLDPEKWTEYYQRMGERPPEGSTLEID